MRNYCKFCQKSSCVKIQQKKDYSIINQNKISYKIINQISEFKMDYLDETSTQYVNEKYKIWKKNAPFLYNMLQVFELPTCSQTVQWFSQSFVQNDWRICSTLIGSNSLQKNYLSIVDVALPTDNAVTDYTTYQQKPSNNNIGTMGQQNLKIKLTIPQNSEIMKARINKAKQNIIACKTGGINCQLLIYNLNNEVDKLQQNKISLQGHQYQGFGLAWHPTKENYLLSGSSDKYVLIWDLHANGGKQTNPFYKVSHNEGVQDTKWSKNQFVFGSVGQDKIINLWDLREIQRKPVISRSAHTGDIYTLDFNPFNQYLLLTGSDDSDIILWDTRNMSKKVHTFIGHNEGVNVVKWSDIHPLRFASGSSDKKIVVWDVGQIKNNESTPSEMMFIHGGHRTKVTDLDWLPGSYNVASTQQGNILQAWLMNEAISSND